jgi:glycosyltransferase involved in cell wall biosynthesis
MPGLIAHEWIAQHGGSENVAEAMGRAFPDADLVTLWNDAPSRFKGHDIRETWLARTPLRKHKAAALPFMSQAWRAIRTSEYEFVLASSHVFAHHVGGENVANKYVYVHTPARTIWAPEQDSRGANPLVQALSPYYQRMDRRFVSSGVQYAANSRYIQSRIRQTWAQDATVIYPPVDVRTIRQSSSGFTESESEALDRLPSQFLLGASRFVPYKRLDLVIDAGAAAGMPVVLAGSGPMRSELARRAADSRIPVAFIESPSDVLLHELYRRATVFLFPAVEDFGIMPVEAMAAGTPAVTYSVGGASESVDIVRGGVVTESLEPADVARAIRQATSINMSEVPSRVEQHFGEGAFRRRLNCWMGRGSEDHLHEAE